MDLQVGRNQSLPEIELSLYHEIPRPDPLYGLDLQGSLDAEVSRVEIGEPSPSGLGTNARAPSEFTIHEAGTASGKLRHLSFSPLNYEKGTQNAQPDKCDVDRLGART